MTSRTERHRQMAEAALRAHMAMTQAHVEGGEPVTSVPTPTGKKVVVYTPQYGENAVDASPLGASDGALRELRMFWKRIPGFGIKEYEIFPSETGWAQVTHWRGTGEDGNEYLGQEVDIVHTDDDLDVTRFEIYSDSKQWMKLVEYANDKPARELPSYSQLLAES